MSDLIKKSNVSIPLAQYISSNAYLNQTALDALLMVLHWVVETPTEDAVPVVHAHWIIPTYIGSYRAEVPHCSACNGIPAGVDEKTKYCPHCGAKMDGGAL